MLKIIPFWFVSKNWKKKNWPTLVFESALLTLLTAIFITVFVLDILQVMLAFLDLSNWIIQMISPLRKMFVFSHPGNITITVPNYTAAAYDFIRAFRKGELGQVMLDWANFLWTHPKIAPRTYHITPSRELCISNCHKEVSAYPIDTSRT